LRSYELQTFEHLLSPIKIRKLEFANRVVMPPMGTSLGNDDGTVSEALLAYISRQAKSAVGLVISEVTAVERVTAMDAETRALYEEV